MADYKLLFLLSGSVVKSPNLINIVILYWHNMTANHEGANSNSFFDPKPPAPPEEVLGIPTVPLIEFSKNANDLLYVAPYFNGKTTFRSVDQRGKHVLALFPLIERLQAGEEIAPEDVRPYLKSIKKAVPKLGKVDKLAAVSGLRKALNHKIERDFIERVPEVLSQARKQSAAYLPQMEPEVSYLAGFENPREEFVSEIALVASAIRETARSRAGRLHHSEVTANDAGYAIRQELGRLMLNKDDSQATLPLLTHFALEKAPKSTKLPDERTISVAAPEIMAILEAPLPKNQRDSQFRASIRRNPHSMRGMAMRWKSFEMGQLKDGTHVLSSLRDLLPTTGQEVRNRFERIKDFLADPQK
jgi:hypothetical protein